MEYLKQYVFVKIDRLKYENVIPFTVISFQYL